MSAIKKYEQYIGSRAMIQKSLDRKMSQLEEIEEEVGANYEAVEVLSEISKEINEDIIKRIESIVTLAIRFVYDRPFEVKIILDSNKNNVKANIVVMEDGEEYDIRSELAGGFVDIASFAMRIAIWSIKHPRLRNLFIFDEPFKWTGKYMEKAGHMMRYFAEKLDLQIILITHDEVLSSLCDRVYFVSHDGKTSTVKEIDRKLRRRRRK